MKKILFACFLVIAMLLGMTGCNTNSNSASSTINQDTLPEELKKAYTLNIAGDELFKKYEETITVGELSELIQTTLSQMYHIGELKVLSEAKAMYNDDVAKRYDMVELLYLAEAERIFGYEKIQELKERYSAPIINERYSLVEKRMDNTYGECSIQYCCIDLSEIDESRFSGLLLPGRAGAHVEFFLKYCDLSTGEKILTLDENQKFNPESSVSIQDALLVMTRYYGSKLPEAVFVLPKEIGIHSIDKALYTGSTTLPDASNQQLPQWKGMLLCHETWTIDGANGCDVDDIVMENDIKTLAECGFNFARVGISFSRLQSANTLTGTIYPQEGTLNLREIEYLDQILSWGMEYGVHIQFVMFEVPGANGDVKKQEVMFDLNDSIFTDEQLQKDVADIWGALARRYKDIPNNYLSFNLMNEPNHPNDQAYVAAYLPSIEAIRKESADRVLVADVHDMDITGEEMAKQGVALSYHLYEPREFCVPNMYLYAKNPSAFDAYDWPYTDKDGKVWDANACLNQSDLLVTPLELKEIAKKNNVGFMIGEWGCFYDGEGGTLFPFAYSNEIRKKFFTDIIHAFEENGIGWSYGSYIGGLGLVTPYPVPDADVTYEKIPNSAHYKVKENYDIFHGLLAE
ncbi:endoglucanase C307 precursor [Anaerotignum neopropionicum]|uniref:Endoglucanase C307 n=1 Tax=Anaerotignum neopropionicum TaxID=36847 RepID=A0A136WI66_9FIRM|nr:cellulase family glycosylhydrolase [Anaerotignum neopropionicum]KXL54258.1 endoglucanase C307 precursor [Anaerotignum neopropionicum]KXL54383.1 endoglucanase C307 precursor [Anaerotignum neopropionicum]